MKNLIENRALDFEQKKIYEVTEISLELKISLEQNPAFGNIWIRGETSRVTYHSSGHLYFSLKDSQSLLNAVMWRSQANKLKFEIHEGMSVLVNGNLTVFTPRSNYQIQVMDIIPEGIGKLQQKIEQLKIALMKEGLFDPDRKKKLPFLPWVVGVVTSPTGAAFRDIVKVLRNRYPNVNILLAPCSVQGEEAVLSIVKALEIISDPVWQVDVIILARGGGSLEDLMAFNDEQVVRKIKDLPVPLITGIGHEIDFTLADFAADFRGATPSQAAEIAVPAISSLEEKINSLKSRIRAELFQKLEFQAERLLRLSSHRLLQKPGNYINELIQKIDQLDSRCHNLARWHLDRKFLKLEKYKELGQKIRNKKKDLESRFSLLVEKLEGLSPLKAIARGYSYVRSQDGSIVHKKQDVKPGDKLKIRIIDAILGCRVEEIEDL